MSPLGSLSRLIAGILLLVGAPFLCVGIYEAVEMQQFINASGQAVGTIMDNVYITINEGGTESGAYYPVVEFVPESGTAVSFQDGIGSLPPDYAEGQTVDVLYDPANPRDARLRSWKRLWFAPTLFMVIGLLPLTVFGIWLALWGRGARPVKDEAPGARRGA